MLLRADRTALATMTQFDINNNKIVGDETRWRIVPQCSVFAAAPRVIPTRWRAVTDGVLEADAETPNDRHVVKIALRNMNIQLSTAGRIVQDGVVRPGFFHVSEPGNRARCFFRGSYDVLHLHIPNLLVADCISGASEQEAIALRSTCGSGRDIVVERLGRALLEANELGGSSGQLYADCMSLAVVARLLARSHPNVARKQARVSELARWRLKRVVDFIESNLEEPLSLADLAATTGLTRMHFAAQFRAATGLRPHEYVLRRRVERAQELLSKTGAAVVDVALSVGFQSQAHFTSVFTKFVGQPPRAWRLSLTRNETGPEEEIATGVFRQRIRRAANYQVTEVAA